jgi:DNA-binding transcriptional ArsR family regulator
MAQADADAMALRMRALGDPGRLRILAHLAGREVAVVDIVGALASITQPTVSHHLRVLMAAGFVTCRRDGRYVLYRLSRGADVTIRWADL